MENVSVDEWYVCFTIVTFFFVYDLVFFSAVIHISILLDSQNLPLNSTVISLNTTDLGLKSAGACCIYHADTNTFHSV